MMTFEKSYGETYTRWIESFGTTYKIKGALFYPDIVRSSLGQMHTIIETYYAQLVTADAGALGRILGKETYSYGRSSNGYR